MRYMKIWTKDAEESTALQRNLFELGYSWPDDGQTIKSGHVGGIFTYQDGTMTYSTSEHTFCCHTNPEYEIEVKIELKEARDKVIIFGNEYYREDVEKVLDTIPKVG